MSDLNQIFIVDDDAAVRDSLTMLLEVAGYEVATFSGAKDFLDFCKADTMGCIILDVSMPSMDGPALQEELSRLGLRLPIIFLSGQGTIALTVRTMKAGAMDFLTKPVEGTVLLARVQTVFEQYSVQQYQAKSSKAAAALLSNLTKRELEVVMLTVEGLSCKEIALRLTISYRTVETHRTHIKQKTGISNMLELAHVVMLQANSISQFYR